MKDEHGVIDVVRASKVVQEILGQAVTTSTWLASFDHFAAWALANGYRSDLTLDREDNSGWYAPWNCLWSTRKGQAQKQAPADVKEGRFTVA